MAWFTQLRHFLDDRGEFWDIRGPGRKLAEYLCSIVKAATSEILEIPIPTGIRCRRRPKRKPCKGEVYTFLDNEKSIIEWYCPECKDNGYISDWENTKWDMRFSADKDLAEELDILYEGLEIILDSNDLKTLH